MALHMNHLIRCEKRASYQLKLPQPRAETGAAHPGLHGNATCQ